VTDGERDDSAPETKKGLSTPLIIIIVVGVVALVSCVCIGVLVAIAVPNMVSARKAGNEIAAVGALRTIATAQAVFREGDKDQNGKLDYAGSLKALGDAQLVDGVLASGTKQGYLFKVRTGKDPLFDWSANADPAVPKTTGDRWFFIDQSGVIRSSTTGPADETSEPTAGFH
jgi:type II secretory pathway pseudopilin PulG